MPMYNNKITRKLDSRGRFCIPKNIREVYELETAEIEVFTENDLIIIRKVIPDEPLPRQRTRETSHCNFCICSSCNGFGCPWVDKVYRYNLNNYLYNRCSKCVKKGLEKIHDCDFYTAKKRVKFYYKRKIAVKSKYDVVLEELQELKKLVRGL